MKQYQRLIITAGVSAIQRPNIAEQWIRSNAPEYLVNDRVKPPADAEQVGTLMSLWRGTLPVVTDGKRVSAEYSTLFALQQRRQLGSRPEVVLIHTDSGAVAAELTKDMIQRDFTAKVKLIEIADLDPTRAVAFQAGLGTYMHWLAWELRSGDPSFTCFAPIGGYKIMTAFGVLVGAYLKYPTLYLHEEHQVPLELPWLPLRIDEQELIKIAPLIRRTVAGTNIGNLGPTEKRDMQRNSWLFERTGEEEQDIVSLNAFGHFLRAEPSYCTLIGPRIRASAHAWEQIRNSNGVDDLIRSGVADLLRKLQDPAIHRGVLNHEVRFKHQGTPFHLFKGSSYSAGAFRSAYRWDETEDTLYLRHVWWQHELYQREAARQSTFYGDENTWTDVSRFIFKAE